MNHSYAQHLKYIWEEQEELMFFNHLSHAYPVSALRGGKTLAPTLTPATLCYYDVDGNITEGEVTDMGELLEQLRESEIDLYQDGDETYPHPPITISGGLPNVPCHQEDSFYIIITLHTDIWLPRVRGDLERSIQRRKNPKPPIDLSNIAEAIKIDYGKLFEQINRGEYVPNLNPDYDNLELAMCHTPRFNRFLAEVKQLTLDLGGEFSSERGNINGIILP